MRSAGPLPLRSDEAAVVEPRGALLYYPTGALPISPVQPSSSSSSQRGADFHSFSAQVPYLKNITVTAPARVIYRPPTYLDLCSVAQVPVRAFNGSGSSSSEPPLPTITLAVETGGLLSGNYHETNDELNEEDRAGRLARPDPLGWDSIAMAVRRRRLQYTAAEAEAEAAREEEFWDLIRRARKRERDEADHLKAAWRQRRQQRAFAHASVTSMHSGSTTAGGGGSSSYWPGRSNSITQQPLQYQQLHRRTDAGELSLGSRGSSGGGGGGSGAADGFDTPNGGDDAAVGHRRRRSTTTTTAAAAGGGGGGSSDTPKSSCRRVATRRSSGAGVHTKGGPIDTTSTTATTATLSPTAYEDDEGGRVARKPSTSAQRTAKGFLRRARYNEGRRLTPTPTSAPVPSPSAMYRGVVPSAARGVGGVGGPAAASTMTTATKTTTTTTTTGTAAAATATVTFDRPQVEDGFRFRFRFPVPSARSEASTAYPDMHSLRESCSNLVSALADPTSPPLTAHTPRHVATGRQVSNHNQKHANYSNSITITNNAIIMSNSTSQKFGADGSTNSNLSMNGGGGGGGGGTAASMMLTAGTAGAPPPGLSGETSAESKNIRVSPPTTTTTAAAPPSQGTAAAAPTAASTSSSSIFYPNHKPEQSQSQHAATSPLNVSDSLTLTAADRRSLQPNSAAALRIVDSRRELSRQQSQQSQQRPPSAPAEPPPSATSPATTTVSPTTRSAPAAAAAAAAGGPTSPGRSAVIPSGALSPSPLGGGGLSSNPSLCSAAASGSRVVTSVYATLVMAPEPVPADVSRTRRSTVETEEEERHDTAAGEREATTAAADAAVAVRETAAGGGPRAVLPLKKPPPTVAGGAAARQAPPIQSTRAGFAGATNTTTTRIIVHRRDTSTTTTTTAAAAGGGGWGRSGSPHGGGDLRSLDATLASITHTAAPLGKNHDKDSDTNSSNGSDNQRRGGSPLPSWDTASNPIREGAEMRLLTPRCAEDHDGGRKRRAEPSAASGAAAATANGAGSTQKKKQQPSSSSPVSATAGKQQARPPQQQQQGKSATAQQTAPATAVAPAPSPPPAVAAAGGKPPAASPKRPTTYSGGDVSKHGSGGAHDGITASNNADTQSGAAAKPQSTSASAATAAAAAGPKGPAKPAQKSKASCCAVM